VQQVSYALGRCFGALVTFTIIPIATIRPVVGPIPAELIAWTTRRATGDSDANNCAQDDPSDDAAVVSTTDFTADFAPDNSSLAFSLPAP
jgi:hypothetical protein